MQLDPLDLLAPYQIRLSQVVQGYSRGITNCKQLVVRRLFRPGSRSDHSDRPPAGQTDWLAKPKGRWRLRSLPGVRRPVQTTRTTPHGNIFALPEPPATLDDSDDEEGDSPCFI